MTKIKINATDIAEVVEKYNPFGFKTAKGAICIFKTYDEAYYELIERIYKAGPKMVDAVLFCMDNVGMTLQDAQRFVGSWKMVVGQKECEFFFDWETGGRDRDTQLERFAKGMHLISETKFNKDMFNNALTRFKAKIGVKE